MNLIISTIEIALIIMLPLILFYQRSKWKTKPLLIWIPFIYLLWYLTYGVFHEFMHLIGVWLSGKEIYQLHLFPHFWKGQFGPLYVNYDFQGDSWDFIIILLPYLRDILLAIIGYVIIKRKTLNHPIITGLVLVIFILSSLYDVSDNYIAYLMGYMNDFNALKVSSNIFIAHFIGISIIATTMVVSIKTILLANYYPLKTE